MQVKALSTAPGASEASRSFSYYFVVRLFKVNKTSSLSLMEDEKLNRKQDSLINAVMKVPKAGGRSGPGGFSGGCGRGTG